jgi:hypothetical protein
MPGPPALNQFTTGTTILPSPVNQNFSYLVSAVTSVDNSQIGVAGLYPSQLIPTTIAQATFGGTGGGVNYTFPGSLTLGGGLNLPGAVISSLYVSAPYVQANGAYVPGVFNSSGSSIGSTMKIVTTTVLLSWVGSTLASTVVGLSPSFTNSTSYLVFVQPLNGNNQGVWCFPSSQSASSVQINGYYSSAQTASFYFNVLAIGY